jgi:hypothetical protein
MALTGYASFVDNPIHHELLRQQSRLANVPLPQTLSLPGNAIQNPAFEAGLSSWETTGSVTVVANEAQLSDNPDAIALLYQPVPLTSGVYTITFDFNSDLSDQFSTGTFPDTFFASLYFIDDLNQLDIPGHVFDAATGLMDLDWQGAFNVAGLIGLSPLGPEWSRFSHEFQMTHAHVAIAFEQAGLNGVSGDSSVRIDNVVIALVPEPATGLFMLCGLFLWRARRRWAGQIGLFLIAMNVTVAGLAQTTQSLSDHFVVQTANERSTLDRTTGEIISTVDVTVLNLGGREVLAPLHAVVNLSTGGVAVTGASGGPTSAPYNRYFVDVSPQLTGGRLLSNQGVSFPLTFRRPRTIDFSYSIEPFGLLREEKAPRLNVPQGPFVVMENALLSIPFTAEDDDGDDVTILSGPGISNLVVDATNGNPAAGAVVFSPAFTQAGEYGLFLTAQDPKGYSVSEFVQISVSNENRRPVVYSLQKESVEEGDFLSVDIETFDPDGDDVIVVGTGIPANAHLAGDIGMFYFTPDFDQAGIYTVRVHATDGSLHSLTQSLVITVVDVPDITLETNRLTLVVDNQPSPTLARQQRITGFVNVGTSTPPQRATSAIISGLSPANGRIGQVVTVLITGSGSGPFATHFADGQSLPVFWQWNRGERHSGDVAHIADRHHQHRNECRHRTARSARAHGRRNRRVAGRFSGRKRNHLTERSIGQFIYHESDFRRDHHHRRNPIHHNIGGDGSFSFNGFPPGIYRLLINPPNHEPFVITFTAEEGRTVDIGSLPTRPTVLDASAPASVSLLSVIRRAGQIERGGMDLEQIQAAIRDALLLVGGTEAGVLDAGGNQLNPNVTGGGLVSLTAEGVRFMSQKLDRGAESVSLGDTLYALSFGFIWPDGGPPQQDAWIADLQAGVNAAWASPNDPENQLLILIFNNGPTLANRPPVLSAATRLNPLQAFLLTSSFLAYVVDRNVNGNASLWLDQPVSEEFISMNRGWWSDLADVLLPSAHAQGPPSSGRLYTGYWRGFATARANFAEPRLSGAFADYVGMQMMINLSSSSLAGTAFAGQLAGQVGDELNALFQFQSTAARVPEPPRITSSQIVTNEGGGVSVEVRFKPCFSHRQLQSRTFVYSLYRFGKPNEPRELVGYVVVDGTTQVPVFSPLGNTSIALSDFSSSSFANMDFAIRDDEPLPWIQDDFGQPVLAPKATWFYALTATRLTRPDIEVDKAFLDRTVSWWTQPLSGRVDGLSAYANRNWQALVSDYSDPVVITVTPYGSPEAEQIEVDPTSGWVYYFNPTNQNVYLVPPVDLGTSISDGGTFANAGFAYPPGGKGMAVDSDGNIYIGNAASEAQFGGRIFRYDKFGAAKRAMSDRSIISVSC